MRAGSVGPEVGAVAVALLPARRVAGSRPGALLSAPPGCRRGPWGAGLGAKLPPRGVL